MGAVEMNPYEQAREERIRRNNAMLAQLEVSGTLASFAEHSRIPDVSWLAQTAWLHIPKS